MSYKFLPGVQVFTVDGGLVARRVPRAKSTVVVGTADKGPADSAYQVTDRAAAALTFGFGGSLIRGMEEVASYSDNVILYRMGTSPLKLKNVGKDLTVGSTTPGFNLTFSEVTSDAATRYKIWYKSGVLAVWLDGNLVFSNDSGLGAVDIGNVVADAVISGNVGLTLGSGSSALYSAAITVAAAVALTGTSDEPPPTKIDPVTGTGLTGRGLYVALAKALDMLENFPVDQVYCPSAVIDQPNVSKYVVGDSTTSANNPASNVDALDWIKVTAASDGSKTYQWASDTVDDQGNTVAAMGVVGNGSARIAAGFYEADFGYLMANFCYQQGQTLGGCIAFIGTTGPKSFSLANTRAWVGFLPTYGNVNSSIPTVDGKGLLGIPSLVGCTAGKLHTLAADKSTGRSAGYFANDAGQYDGGVSLDGNQNPIDIGAYVHVVGDHAIMSNGYRANYEANIVGMVAGLCSALDEKSNLTNKPLNVIQAWRASQPQMDALTFAKVNVLRFRGNDTVPSLLHGFTAASEKSDYTNLLRVRIKFMIVKVVFDEGIKFIGTGTLDGLQLSAMKTALESRAVQLQKRGYVSFADFIITTTDADRRIGHARVDIKFTPADELVQLSAFVGITR